MSTAKLVKWCVPQTVRVGLDSDVTSLTPSFAHKLWYTKKEKIYHRTLQSASCASFKTVTKQHIEMVCICWAMYLLVNHTNSAVTIRFNKVKKEKEILPDYVVWKKKRNFTFRGHSNRSTVLLNSPLPANMSKHQNTLSNFVRVRFCGGEACVIVGVSEIHVRCEGECFDHH